MKYGIWRHEDALGNSAEQCVNLSNFIQKNNDTQPKIYVESLFQKYFAMCIPHVKENDIFFFDKEKYDLDHLNVKFNGYTDLHDIIMPDVYFGSVCRNYPSVWANLKDVQYYLRFPHEDYNKKYEIPSPFILMQFREGKTYWKRVDGDNCEPERNVNKDTFFKLALHYANKGITVVRIGDPKQTEMPSHKNIIDFTRIKDKTMLDDLYLLDSCKVFISTDSGIWPMAGGLRKNMVLSNVVSGQNKPAIVNWLDKNITEILFKHNKRNDNSLEQLIKGTERFL
jgi:putative glycosyltransferase (TIGR04372 family)